MTKAIPFSIPCLALWLSIVLLSGCSQESARREGMAAPAPSEQPAGSPAGNASTGAFQMQNAKKSAADELEKNADDPASANAFITAVSSLGKFDGIKKFVRTAELRFRVDNVLQSTLQIENIAQKNGGFVTANNLNTQVESRIVTQVSRDSSVSVCRYTMHNQLTVRVPSNLLDTTLREIGKMARFLDYRRVKATDVGLQILEQELKQNRLQDHQQQIEGAIRQSGKPGDITRAADHLLNSRESSDASKIEMLKLDDAIQYSTIQLDLYGDPQAQHQMLAEPRAIASFEPGFGKQLADAFMVGWQLFKGLLLLLLKAWSFGVAILAVWLLWKYRVKIKG